MAYQRIIVRCVQRYQGLGWAMYDIEFRQRAARNKSLDWGVIDDYLYAEHFTGTSNPVPRCQSCLDEHNSQACPLLAASWLYHVFAKGQQPASQLHTAPSTILPPAATASPRPNQAAPIQEVCHRPATSVTICGSFNSRFGNRCTLANCTYQHICTPCKGADHNRANCSGSSWTRAFQVPPAKRFRGCGRSWYSNRSSFQRTRQDKQSSGERTHTVYLAR